MRNLYALSIGLILRLSVAPTFANTLPAFGAYVQRQQSAVDSWEEALGLDPDTGREFMELPVVGVRMRPEIVTDIIARQR